MKKKGLIILILVGIFLHQGQIVGEDARLPGNNQGGQAQYHFQKAHRFYLDSNHTQAEVEFKKALKSNPKLPDAHYYLGSIYFKQGAYTEAIEQCKEALKIDSGDLKSLIIMGLSFQHLGLNEQAIKAFQRAERLDSRSAAVHSALGLAYCAKGDLARAKEECGILKQIDSELAKDLWQKIEEQENKRPTE